jgi:apolipoprotein D and lipocalin family protein
MFLKLLILFSSFGFAGDVVTIPELDLERYQGTWNQIATIPASFQKDCYSDTKAEYLLNDDGTVSVLNSCLKVDKKSKDAKGRARLNPKYSTSSKLEVSFVSIFGKWIWMFGGDYWVLDLDSGYQVSLVGSPDRKYAWILAREKTVPKERLAQLVLVLEKNGFDPCELKMSRFSDLPEQDEPTLCEFLAID